MVCGFDRLRSLSYGGGMFTGIVEIQGLIYARVVRGNDISLEVESAGFEQSAVNVGDRKNL